MAAPNLRLIDATWLDAGGAWTYTALGASTVGDIIIFQVLQDGATSGAVTVSAFPSCVSTLGGTGSSMDYLGEFAVGNPVTAYQHLWIGRAITTNQFIVSGGNSTSEDLYGRAYHFSNASTGTTVATVIENGSGATENSTGLSNTAAVPIITTHGANRLALAFVAVNDDNAIARFTGESGGTWCLATTYAESSGTDGAIALQVARPSAVPSHPQRSGSGSVAVYGDVAGSGSGELAAQSFTTSSAITVTHLTLGLFRSSSPTDDYIVEIQTDSSNLPSGTVVGTGGTVHAADIPTAELWYEFEVSASLSASTKYWVVLRRTGTRSLTNFVSWVVGQDIVSGEGFTSRTSGTWDPVSGLDLCFQVLTADEDNGSTLINGSGSITDSDSWGVVGFALIGTGGGVTTVPGSFTASAAIKKTVSSSLSASAITKRTQTGSLIGSAFFARTVSGSFTAATTIKRTITRSLTASVITKRAQAGSLSAAGITQRGQSGSFKADAWLIAGMVTIPGSFSAAAVLKRIQSGSATGAAVLKGTQASSFIANAIIKRTQAGSFTSVAITRKTIDGSLAANAVKRYSTTVPFSAYAVLMFTHGGPTDAPHIFTADAWLRRAQAGSLTATAVLLRSQIGSVTAGAITKRGQAGSFTADAWFTTGMVTVPGSFSASAAIATLITQDTFTRTVAPNSSTWGTNDDGSLTWIVHSGTNSDQDVNSVDGSVAVVTNGGFTGGLNQFQGYPILRSGIVQFDFRYPGAFTNIVVLDTCAGVNDRTRSDVLSVQNGGSGAVDLWNYYGDYAHVSGLVAGDWVTVQGHFHEIDGTLTVLKAWRRGDSEPPGVNTVASNGQQTGNVGLALLINTGTTGPTYRVDNFYWWSSQDWSWNKALIASAVLSKTQAFSLTASAVLLSATEDTLTADAVVSETTAGSFTADAWLTTGLVTIPGDFTASAIIKREATGQFFVSAVTLALYSSMALADAVIRASASNTASTDAIILSARTTSLGSDSVIRRTSALSFSADAIARISTGSSFSANAVVRRTTSAGIGIDAILLRGSTASLTTSAILLRATAGSLTADAQISRAVASSFSASAILKSTTSGSFVASAAMLGTRAGSVTTDAITLRTRSGSLSTNAVVARVTSDSVTALSWLRRGQAASVVADAIQRQTITGSLTADALVGGYKSGAISADAILGETSSGAFSAQALLVVTASGSVSADAVLFETRAGTFSAGAVLAFVAGDTFTADADLSYVGRCVWTTPINFAVITAVPTLRFLIPQAVGSMHFEIHIDTVDTFDSPNLRVLKSYASQDGWEYWDGGAWQPITLDGVANTYAGNEARHTIQVELDGTTWFRRVRAGVV